MSRVLIWKKVSPGTEYDIFRGAGCIAEYNQGENFNVGNRLWFQGIMSAIDTDANQYSFLSDELNAEVINSEFDMIILPMANIFNRRFRTFLEDRTFETIKIPVYVIACGAQADDYDDLELLIREIGEPSKRFIGAVYHTGGEFALRGEFTKAFFDRLGFPSAVVTGCPSMYQFGRSFTAVGSKPDAESYKPVFNGNIEAIQNLMELYSDSLFMDQDTLWKELYFEYKDKPTFRSEIAFYCNYSPYTAKLLSEDRVRLIPDMYNWHTFLRKMGFDYSFGSRIHGSIMAILSGIPATIVAIDTRTREMAEFFSIPYVKHDRGHVYTHEEFKALYRQADYTKFNETYLQKYQVYEHFLLQHGIVGRVNQSNRFFSDDREYFAPPKAVNTQYFKEISSVFSKRSALIRCVAKAATIKHKLHERNAQP